MGFLNQTLDAILDGIKGLVIPATPSDELGKKKKSCSRFSGVFHEIADSGL
jgi:hypothetical protein